MTLIPFPGPRGKGAVANCQKCNGSGYVRVVIPLPGNGMRHSSVEVCDCVRGQFHAGDSSNQPAPPGAKE